MKPVDAVIAVTFRCNARCIMCGIWKADSGPDLPLEVCRKLPPCLRDINLTGGEPYLRDDLPSVHAACREACPKAQTILSTNGILTERIIAATRQMARNEPHIGVAVSIDGPLRIHDRIRGMQGAFEKAMATVKGLQDTGIDNLRLAFTCTRQNIAYMSEVYDLARESQVQFTCTLEHRSEHYFHADAPPVELPPGELEGLLLPLMRSELRSLSPKRWARAYFMNGLHAFATGRGRPLPCRAGRDHFFMDPAGEVFTCNAAPYRMGNLAQDEFDTLWNSQAAMEARRKAKVCQPGCWMICTARTAIKAAWPRVLAWALTRKLFGLPPDGDGS